MRVKNEQNPSKQVTGLNILCWKKSSVSENMSAMGLTRLIDRTRIHGRNYPFSSPIHCETSLSRSGMTFPLLLESSSEEKAKRATTNSVERTIGVCQE
jgi:hypothetical protein